MAPYLRYVDPLLEEAHRRRCESYSSGLLVSQKWKDLGVSLALLLHEQRGFRRRDALYHPYFPRKTMESLAKNCAQKVFPPVMKTRDLIMTGAMPSKILLWGFKLKTLFAFVRKSRNVHKSSPWPASA